MKTGKLLSIKVLVVAALLALANQSHALYTNYLDVAVGTLTAFSNSLATMPSPTPLDKKHLAEVKHALKDLGKPSVSVAGDYNLFFFAVAHLGDLATTPTFDDIGTNAFNAFLGEAQSEFMAASVRVAMLNDFVPTKRAASNQLAQVYAAFITLGANPTNKQLGLLLGRQIYTKLTAANRLAALGEAHSGFAADGVIGKTLVYHVAGKTGMEVFTDATNTDSTDLDGSHGHDTYTYTRTGLNAATLMINGGGGGTTTVNARFSSAGGGTFTFHHTGNNPRSGAGTFTLN